MSVVTFLFLLVIAALAAGVAVLITGPWGTRSFVAWFVFGALLLVLPTLLPLFIHP
jgi:hypothetical protein